MRLDYRKIIPYVEYLSKKVSTMLSENESLEIENKGDDDDE